MKHLALALLALAVALPAAAQRPLKADDIKPNEWMPPQHIEEWCLVHADNSRIMARLTGIEWHGKAWPISTPVDATRLAPATQRHTPETSRLFSDGEGVTIPLGSLNVAGLIDFRGSLFALTTGNADTSPTTVWRVDGSARQPIAVRILQVSGQPSGWAVAGDDAILFSMPGQDLALLPDGSVEHAKARYMCGDTPTEP